MTPVHLWHLDDLSHKRKVELTKHAEAQLAEARKPWRLWSEYRDRLAAITTTRNIASLLELEELLEESEEVWQSLKLQGGRAA